MRYIDFKTDMRGIQYNQKMPDGSVQTHTENIPIAIGACPKCGAILFSQEGMVAGTLHKIAAQQMGNSAAYCHNCGENYCVGPIINAQYTVIKEEDAKDGEDHSSGEDVEIIAESE